ncbi:MAG: nickel insertion protein [Bilophila sp.]
MKQEPHLCPDAKDDLHDSPKNSAFRAGDILTVRALSGLSGDMMLAGLLYLSGLYTKDEELNALLATMPVPTLSGCVRLERRFVRHIAGWGCHIELPPEHEHRTHADIMALINASSMEPAAASLALRTFSLLAEAEGRVHGLPAAEVRFHEVGALDSILDICLTCALFVRLAPSHFVCSPLPIGDGGILCAHGWIPTPAPAVLELLTGIPVCGFFGTPAQEANHPEQAEQAEHHGHHSTAATSATVRGCGETVTPTAIALLKALGATFGAWPAMTVRDRALVYGSRVFDNAPNGAIWACGTSNTPATSKGGKHGHA